MDTALWIVQGLGAALFLMAGGMKLMAPLDQLKTKLTWVEDFSPLSVRLIGLSEVAGALGLVLPMWLGTAPVLTPLAAAGLVVAMLAALGLHVKRGEYGSVVVNLVLAGLMGFIVYGRYYFIELAMA